MSPLNTINLQRIFNELDKNRDGLLSVDELVWLLDRVGVQAQRDDLELLLGKTCLDPIDFVFFCETLIKGGNTCKQECREVQQREDEALHRDLAEAFRVFDLNGDGYISCEELQATLSRLGLWDERYGQDCKRMIDAYDTNSDGLLDFEEFKDMMLLTNR